MRLNRAMNNTRPENEVKRWSSKVTSGRVWTRVTISALLDFIGARPLVDSEESRTLCIRVHRGSLVQCT